MGTGELLEQPNRMLVSNPAIDLHPIQGGVEIFLAASF